MKTELNRFRKTIISTAKKFCGRCLEEIQIFRMQFGKWLLRFHRSVKRFWKNFRRFLRTRLKHHVRMQNVLHWAVCILLFGCFLSALSVSIAGNNCEFHLRSGIINDNYDFILYTLLTMLGAMISLLFVLSNLKTTHNMPIYSIVIEHYEIYEFILLTVASLIVILLMKINYSSTYIFVICFALLMFLLAIFIIIIKNIIRISVSYAEYIKILIKLTSSTIRNLDSRNEKRMMESRKLKELYELKHFAQYWSVYNTDYKCSYSITSKKQFAVDILVLSPKLKSFLKKIQVECENKDIICVSYLSPEHTVNAGDEILGFYTKEDVKVPKNIISAARRFSKRIVTGYVAVNDEYSDRMTEAWEMLKKLIDGDSTERTVSTVSALMDAYWIAINSEVR